MSISWCGAACWHAFIERVTSPVPRSSSSSNLYTRFSLRLLISALPSRTSPPAFARAQQLTIGRTHSLLPLFTTHSITRVRPAMYVCMYVQVHDQGRNLAISEPIYIYIYIFGKEMKSRNENMHDV